MRDCLSMVIIAITIATFVILGIGIYSYGEKKNNIELAKAAGYECYLDGEEVDIDTIDFNLYSCVFDKENKTVYMTTKSNNRTAVVPFLFDRRNRI